MLCIITKLMIAVTQNIQSRNGITVSQLQVFKFQRVSYLTITNDKPLVILYNSTCITFSLARTNLRAELSFVPHRTITPVQAHRK